MRHPRPTAAGSYNDPFMPLDRLDLPADARFWSAAARAVCDFAERHGVHSRHLQALTWLVPAGPHVAAARSALHATHSNDAFFPPRIVPLAAWLGQPLVAGTAARAELFAALRANRWVRESFGAQPATLWALARDISQLCDQLTWAAPDGSDALDGQLQASLARHFHRRAARTLLPQAQLVLQLWRAQRAGGDGAVRALRELQSRASRAEAPLIYVGAALSRTTAGVGLAGWERAFLETYSMRAPVLAIVPDVAQGLGARPLLAAAWPELTHADPAVAIAERADAIRKSARAHSMPLSIVAAGSLEDEAIAVARQVLAWRREGIAPIALVALDRLTARRVRALLERAQVSVRDETGWKLSTTSAAAAVMRWYDLAADDLYWRDVLDWLKSTFTLAGRADKAHEVFIFERAIRAGGVLQGARAMRRAIDDLGKDLGEASVAGAFQVLALIEAQVLATQRASPTFRSHATALRQTLDMLGMRAALALDPVGSALLQELDALEVELSAVEGRATLADFRALLAARFEEVAFVDRQVSSPIVMVSLAATTLRTFDAAVVIGADAQHLPAAPTELLFMSDAVCSELGLATADDAAREQAAQLAALLVSVPRVVATWRTHQADEPNTLSPLLERLQMVCMRVLGDDLTRPGLDESFEVESIESERPAPGAPALMASRLTASHAQSLVNCAYQFYARRLLGLTELEDVVELPDKRDFGEVLHEILRRFHRTWGAVDFSSMEAAHLTASLAEHARAVFGPKLERAPGLLAYQRRFDGLIDGYVEWLQENSREGWRWTAGEESYLDWFTLRDGRAVELVGRVDRIDARADGVLRVIDYKARAPDVLTRALKEPGEDIQLPFYGMLLAHHVDGEALGAAYLSFDRAREGRPGVQAVAPTQRFGALVSEVGDRLRADLQRIADGASLPAIGVESVCKYCEMRGLCRRDYWETSDDEERRNGGAADEGAAA